MRKMKMEFSARTRAQNIKRLKTEFLDVLVIGGGIVGAGVIRDLALNGGIKAGLIEQSDFASGTSSSTSQLIHGGFRYLSKGDITLVKKARREREVLLRIAPKLVKSLPIAILRYTGDRYPLAGIQIAANYYNHLSQADRAEKSHVIRDVKEIQRRIGTIEKEGLKGAVIIWDSTVNDARLCLLTVKNAYKHGAIVTNYVRFLEFARQTRVSTYGVGGDTANPETIVNVEDTISGERFSIRAKHIISAAGPWTDKIWEKEQGYDGVPKLSTQKAKGIHIVLPRLHDNQYGIAAFTQAEKSIHGKPRIIFILPAGEFDELTLIGTTETHPESTPESVRPSIAEVEYLLGETRRILPNAALKRSNVISAYAGVRPLIAAKSKMQGTAAVHPKIFRRNLSASGIKKTGSGLFISREHIITESENGVIYIYGGKLTTHRLIAEETGNRLAEKLGVARRCKTHTQLLHDINHKPKIGARHLHTTGEKLTPPTAHRTRLIHRYGADTEIILKWITEKEVLAESMTESLPFLKAEILYAFWGEMAMNLEDFLWRRTRIGWTAGQGVDLAPKIAQFLGKNYNWDEERINREIETYAQHINWLNEKLK